MADPKLALTVAAIVAVAAVLLLWPRRGGLWRAIAAVRAGERVRIEDALRHLYDCESAAVPGTRGGLAEALRWSCARTTRLAGRLVELGLVRVEGVAYRLTPQGRSEALRVLRVHRLWDRYTSGDTGPDPQDERGIVPALRGPADGVGGRRPGAPDPHAGAEGPPALALPDLPVGRPAEIIDIGHEPREAYAQLLAEGLQLGMHVRLLERTPTRTRLEVDGDEVILAPVVAALVTAIVLVEPGSALPPTRLSSLRPGEPARVAGLSPSCRGVQRRRLLDLGLVPGTVVEVELESAGGDPSAYRVRGALLALRREQAHLVHVEHVAGRAPA